MKQIIKRCERCILPETFPGVNLSLDGICQFCKEYEDNPPQFSELRNKVENFVQQQIGTSQTYDIVLAFSGGKDSTYTLKYLKEAFNAKIIAITIDNGFISEAAYQNCRNVTSILGVDHIFFKPSPVAMKEIYNKSYSDDIHSLSALKRASSICYSCIQVINTQMLNFATNFKVPIVAGGYIGGQVPSTTGLMEQNLKVTGEIRKTFMNRLGKFFKDDSLSLFTQQIGELAKVSIINPMIYLNKSEDEILAEIKTIDWIQPTDTGNFSTNCLLNDFAIFHHIKKYNFHPYIFEISNMVRVGNLSKQEAIHKVSTNYTTEEFSNIMKKLGLK